MIRLVAFFLLTFLAVFQAAYGEPARNAPRNVVLIYADDIGYGDFSCYGAKRVKTPNIDKLAAGGLKFTDAHSPAATCTPSRYAMLTGEYAWRRKGTGIARGNAPLIIAPNRVTLADVFKKAGYRTGVVGKWHLGLGGRNLDWNGDIKPGPLELGFDYCFLIPATGDRVPCVYVENHRVVGLDPKDPIKVSYGKPIGKGPTGKKNPNLLKMHPSHGHNQTIVNGISRIGYMTGGKSALWVDEDMADVITKKATDFIDRNKAKPFFLYFSTHDIHVPRVPHKRFVGKTPMGPRGDTIAQLDWCVGQITQQLKKHKLLDDTMIIVTSDNGPVIDDGYKDDAVKKLGMHKAAGPWRGGKYSKFEGGTRVPFIVHWPKRVKAGTTSTALLCQVDLPATFAAMTKQALVKDAAPDSFDLSAALVGDSTAGRDHLIEQGRGLALRKGDWKLIPAGRGAKRNRNTNTELGNSPRALLYNLKTDPGERKNVAKENPAKVKKLAGLLKKLRDDGRSRPE